MAQEPKETYNINGKTDVDESLFEEPQTQDDNGSPQQDGGDDEQTTQQQTPENEGAETEQTPEGGETPQDKGNTQPQGGEQPKPKEGEKWAGKYDNIDQLANAFRNLGGNPERYKDIPTNTTPAIAPNIENATMQE